MLCLFCQKLSHEKVISKTIKRRSNIFHNPGGTKIFLGFVLVLIHSMSLLVMAHDCHYDLECENHFRSICREAI